MVKSIRWRLQLWYAAVLLAVIASFGGMVYYSSRRAALDRIDTKLHAAVSYLDAMLRGFPPPDLDSVRPEPPDRMAFERGGMERPPFERGAPDRPPFDRGPPPGRGGGPGRGLERGGPPRRQYERLLEELDVRKSFGASAVEGDEPPYFVVWRADGSVLKSTDAATPGLWPDWPNRDFNAPAEPIYLQQGEQRAAVVVGPRRTTILVGKPVAREVAELNTLALQLTAGGIVALMLGLLGGWFVSSRILRPVSAIAATASEISSSNLSHRIETESIDRELVGLAQVLNDTFGRLERDFEKQVRFTADASHELRTPLAVLYSQVELALSRTRTPEEYRDTLQRCLQAAARMRGLVDGLLTLARADGGHLDLDPRALNLAQMAEEVVDQHRSGAKRVKVELDAEAPEEPVYVNADSACLLRVVENLTANALRHTPPGGKVHIGIAAENGDAVLTVTDTGTGIPSEDQPRIFERFFRADKARSRTSGGNGLGLAICKSLVEAQGGSIVFQSEPGVQTKFTVRLPRTDGSRTTHRALGRMEYLGRPELSEPRTK